MNQTIYCIKNNDYLKGNAIKNQLLNRKNGYYFHFCLTKVINNLCVRTEVGCQDKRSRFAYNRFPWGKYDKLTLVQGNYFSPLVSSYTDFCLVPWGGHHNESSTLEGLSHKRGGILLPLLPKSGKAHVERSHPTLKE